MSGGFELRLTSRFITSIRILSLRLTCVHIYKYQRSYTHTTTNSQPDPHKHRHTLIKMRDDVLSMMTIDIDMAHIEPKSDIRGQYRVTKISTDEKLGRFFKPTIFLPIRYPTFSKLSESLLGFFLKISSAWRTLKS